MSDGSQADMVEALSTDPGVQQSVWDVRAWLPGALIWRGGRGSFWAGEGSKESQLFGVARAVLGDLEYHNVVPGPEPPELRWTARVRRPVGRNVGRRCRSRRTCGSRRPAGPCRVPSPGRALSRPGRGILREGGSGRLAGWAISGILLSLTSITVTAVGVSLPLPGSPGLWLGRTVSQSMAS